MAKAAAFPVLLITGTVGAGKSAVAGEASAILAALEIPHAFVDLDALSYSWPPRGRFNEVLAFQNLAVVWANFRAGGATRLIVAYVVESQNDLRRYHDAVPGAQLVVCRLTASQATREARLHSREMGAGLAWHLARTAELEAAMQQASLENFQVRNDGRPLDVVAREVLEGAGWLHAGKGVVAANGPSLSEQG